LQPNIWTTDIQPQFSFFHFLTLLLKDLKGATVLMWIHFQTAQLEGVEEAHFLTPG